MKIESFNKYIVIGVVVFLLTLIYTPISQAKIDDNLKNYEKKLFDIEIEDKMFTTKNLKRR